MKKPTPPPILNSEKQNIPLAIGLMLLSGLGFALMNLFIRLAGDLPSMQKTFFRNAVVFFVALVFVWRNHRGKLRIRTKSEGFWLVLRSIFGLLGMLANFYAVDHIPIANASVLNKLSPFFPLSLPPCF